MSEPAYRRPPEDIDMNEEELAIRRAGTYALVACLVMFPAAYFGLGAIVEFPTDLAERLRFGILASVFVLAFVAVAVMMVSTGRRMSAEDIGGSAAGPPSDKLAIKIAFLQNTFEQAVLAAGAFMGWAVMVEGPWLALVVAAVVLFGVGRVLFYRGYPQGASGRALGMSLTMTPTLLGYLGVVVLVVVEIAQAVF